MLSRKYYVMIARVLASHISGVNHIRDGKVVLIARSLADEFEKDNPRFDRAEFYAAVGVPMIDHT